MKKTTMAAAALAFLPAALWGQEKEHGDLRIPAVLRAEHHELHEQLARAAKVEGPVGAAARDLERVMQPHFVREEQIALPPLGLLVALSHGERDASMASIVPLTDSLQSELPQMLREHAMISDAARKLGEAAERARMPEYSRLAEGIRQHARMEEQVMYPAAVLVGLYVKRDVASR